MFRIQSDMWATYHQEDVEDFFQDEDKWAIPRDPSNSDREPVRGDLLLQTGVVDKIGAQRERIHMVDVGTASQTLEFLTDRFGSVLRIGPYLIGRNLNILSISGYAPLDALAAVSGPDVYDMVDNKLGTQREPNRKHAQQCLQYAIGSTDVLPHQEPRFFPDILLNVRSTDTVRVVSASDGETIAFDSRSGDPEKLEGEVVFLEVEFAGLRLPKLSSGPDISRVDGNHRLWAVDWDLDEAAKDADTDADELPIDDDYPSVSFAMLVGLDPDQEAFLFKNINGEHKGMEVAHLAQLAIRVSDYDQMKGDRRQLPQWIAHELTLPGRAFHNMILFGGSKVGVKKAFGKVPPVKLSTLVTTVRKQIDSTRVADGRVEKPEMWLQLIDRYWKAVSAVYPEAWDDAREYILLKTIGLSAFAEFGGEVIDQALKNRTIEVKDFKTYLSAVKETVSLHKDEWLGIAGAGGAKQVAKQLNSAANAETVDRKWLESQLEDGVQKTDQELIEDLVESDQAD